MKLQSMKNWLKNTRTSGKEKARIRTGKGSIATVILMTLILAGIAQNTVPPETEKLLNQLANYEQQVLAGPQEQIRAARAQAVEILSSQLTQVTQQGDLEGALAIQEEIKRLQGELKIQVDNTETSSETQPTTNRTPEDYNGYPLAPGGVLLEGRNSGANHPPRELEDDGAVLAVNGLIFYAEKKRNHPNNGIYFINGYLSNGPIKNEDMLMPGPYVIEEKSSRRFEIYKPGKENRGEGRFNTDYTEVEIDWPGKFEGKINYTLIDPWAEETD